MCVCFLTNSIKITKIRSNLCLRVRESESKRVRERERERGCVNLGTSVTRWLNYVSIFGHMQQ